MSQIDMFSPPKVIKNWLELDWWGSPEDKAMTEFLNQMDRVKKIYCPKRENIFRAFELTPFDKVKVVIIGQDPYPTPSHAHGLAFSVPQGVNPPPSLQNIYKEMKDDIGCYPQTGNLESWARQGVLLLNTILTCGIGYPMSHSDIGWQKLTHGAIRALVFYRKEIVFVCWGTQAAGSLTQALGMGGDALRINGHEVIKSVHPSPKSADRGFFGTRPFSEVNKFLQGNGREPINWCE